MSLFYVYYHHNHHWAAMVSRGWAKASSFCLQVNQACAVVCNFFVNIGSQLAETISSKHQAKPFDSYLRDRCVSTFNFVPVTRDKVISVIHQFAPKKSAGHDLISTNLLK